MNNTWLKIKIWTKLVIIGIVSLSVLTFVAANGKNDATVWLWHDHSFNVLELMAGSFIFGILCTLLAKPIYHTLSQIQHLSSKPPEPLPPAPPPISGPVASSGDSMTPASDASMDAPPQS